MRISDWSSDVCSSDLRVHDGDAVEPVAVCQHRNHVDTATPTEEVVGGGEPEAVALHDLGIVNGDGQLALRVRDGARALLAAEAALTVTHLGFRLRLRPLVAPRHGSSLTPPLVIPRSAPLPNMGSLSATASIGRAHV